MTLPFFFLMVLNAILFIRPMEFIPFLYAVPLYLITVIACLAFSFPEVLRQLDSRSIAERPITACVLGLLVIIPLSNLVRGQIGQAFVMTDGFFKVVITYLLIVGLVDSPEKLRRYLDWMIVFIAIITGVGLLHFYGYVHIDSLKGVVSADGEKQRMGSTGLFGDPNDMGVLIAQGLVLTTDRFLRPAGLMRRAALIGGFALLFYGLQATASRGGMLALLAGLGVYCVARFGRRGVIFGAVVLPILLASVSGRQADFDVSGGTGQARIHLWDVYLSLAISNPVLGIGSGNWAGYHNKVAHNTFLFGFAELGFAGGILFTGAFYAAFRMLHAVRTGPAADDPEMARLRPCLVAVLASLVAGMISLTWTYGIPAYWSLATTTAFVAMLQARAGIEPPLRVGPRLAAEIVIVGVGFVLLIFMYVKLNASYYS